MDIVDISLSKLSFAQKFNLMETIWDDLTKDEKNLESPVWYNDALKDREKAVAAGKAKFSDWTESKETIKRNIISS